MLSQWTMGDWPRIEIPGMPGFYVRVPDTILSTVAFIGYADNASPGGIRCKGTGFLVAYDEDCYLVTSRHIAEPIGDTPFLVRLNRYDGSGSNIFYGDNVKWFHHPDENVDLSVIPFMASPENGYKCMYFTQNDFAATNIIKQAGLQIGIGDNCYTVGLFRYVTGQKANLPVVYSATIALMTEEKIYMFNKYRNRKEKVDGCLIQSQGIPGASGSPVFVRPSLLREGALRDGKKILLQEHMSSIFLFGIVQGAWLLPPDASLRAELGANESDNVPVGISIVVPIDRLVELLRDSKELETMRLRKVSLAQQTSINAEQKDVHEAAFPPAAGANPRHREDFTALLNVAVKKNEPKD